jgi:hypothetical protein
MYRVLAVNGYLMCNKVTERPTVAVPERDVLASNGWNYRKVPGQGAFCTAPCPYAQDLLLIRRGARCVLYDVHRLPPELARRADLPSLEDWPREVSIPQMLHDAYKIGLQKAITIGLPNTLDIHVFSLALLALRQYKSHSNIPDPDQWRREFYRGFNDGVNMLLEGGNKNGICNTRA